MATQHEIVVNLSGDTARNAGADFSKMPTGAYKVTITEVADHPNGNSKQIQTVIAAGEFSGAQQRVFLGNDFTKTGNRRSLRGALLSVGVPAAKLDAGDYGFSWDAQFNGKTGYIYFTAKDENDANSQSKREFITPEAYQQFSKSSSASVTTTNEAGPSLNVGSVPQPGSMGKLRGMIG